MRHVRRRSGKGRKRRGILTFEWILLITLVVIGIIGGLSAVRNALLCELSELAACVCSINICECSECGENACSCSPEAGCEGAWWCTTCSGEPAP